MPQKIVTFTSATVPELEKEAYWTGRFEFGVIVYYFDKYKNEIGFSVEDVPNLGVKCTRDWHHSTLDELIWTRIHKSAE